MNVRMAFGDWRCIWQVRVESEDDNVDNEDTCDKKYEKENSYQVCELWSVFTWNQGRHFPVYSQWKDGHFAHRQSLFSGLGCWIWNLEVPGSTPPPCCYLDLFSVVPRSTPRPRWVNSQLIILNAARNALKLAEDLMESEKLLHMLDLKFWYWKLTL